MAMHLDHYQMSTRNIYKTAQELREETGLGFYDGGYFPNGGIANKIFPLGAGTYIEIEGVVDAGSIATNPGAKRFHERTADGECLSLYCMRVDTMDELKAIATRLNTTVSSSLVTRIRPNGPPVQAYSTPSNGGGPGQPPTPGLTPRNPNLPNWYCHEDRIYMHPSGQPVFNWPGCVEPQGIAWLEVGGAEKEFYEYLGVPVGTFPYKFVNKPQGLYAIGVKTNKGEVVIRRPWRT
jgi:hypothetical protein